MLITMQSILTGAITSKELDITAEEWEHFGLNNEGE